MTNGVYDDLLRRLPKEVLVEWLDDMLVEESHSGRASDYSIRTTLEKLIREYEGE